MIGEQTGEGVITHPENKLRVFTMPAITQMRGEETPSGLAVFVWHEDSDPILLARMSTGIFLPDHAQEQWSCAVHDGDIWKVPISIVGLKRVNHPEKEGMLGHRSHHIVGNSGWYGTSKPSWI